MNSRNSRNQAPVKAKGNSFALLEDYEDSVSEDSDSDSEVPEHAVEPEAEPDAEPDVEPDAEPEPDVEDIYVEELDALDANEEHYVLEPEHHASDETGWETVGTPSHTFYEEAQVAVSEEDFCDEEKSEVDIGSDSEVSVKLNASWTLWGHELYVKSWLINGFNKLLKLDTVGKFCEMTNGIEAIGGLEARFYFLMRRDIEPIWEDPKNRYGVMWSVQVSQRNIEPVWHYLTAAIVGESLLAPEKAGLINGITLSPKDNCYIVKIWLGRNEDISKEIREFLRRYVADLKEVSIKRMEYRPEY